MRVLAFFALFLSCAHAPDPRPRRVDVDAVLDDWHGAAAAADENRYFAHFSPDAVFFGTDATERWDVESFRTWAHPIFAKGRAWSFRTVRRAVFFSGDGKTAWFDEDLETPNLGPARGTGVLVHRHDRWRIAQYNLSVPIPNDVFKKVKALIEQNLLPR